MPISIWPGSTVKVAVPTAGRMHGDSATPMVRIRVPARRVVSATAARLAPCAALAPATLYSRVRPAMPRRRSSLPAGAEATSSAPSTVAVSMPSSAASSAARSKFITSPP